jgi:ATP-dependent Clp protease protease subunit
MILEFGKEIQRMKDSLNAIISEQTGQDISKVEKDTDRDNFMSADEACAYGLIDEVIAKHK